MFQLDSYKRVRYNLYIKYNILERTYHRILTFVAFICDSVYFFSQNMSSNNQTNSNPIAGALTYPSRSEENVEPVPQQPRQPRNLQGLLHFAMDATKTEDAPGNSQVPPLDAERRLFLMEAMQSITINIAQVLEDSIRILTNQQRISEIKEGQPLPEDVQAAFDTVLEYIDDIDVANDFYKLSGFSIFPLCFASKNEELRIKGYSVLAELCQNNPFCQTKVFETEFFDLMFDMLITEKGLAQSKCIYAISCMTREYEPACEALTLRGYCGRLFEVLATTANDPVVRTKISFLIRHLCDKYQPAKEQFIKLGIVKVIAEQIKKGHDGTTEHLLSILLVLTKDSDPIVLQQMRDPDIELKHILEEHIKQNIKNSEFFEEELEYTQDVLNRVFKNWPQVDPSEEADR